MYSIFDNLCKKNGKVGNNEINTSKNIKSENMPKCSRVERYNKNKTNKNGKMENELSDPIQKP
jgi:hypothetical protein